MWGLPTFAEVPSLMEVLHASFSVDQCSEDGEQQEQGYMSALVKVCTKKCVGELEGGRMEYAVQINPESGGGGCKNNACERKED